MCFWLKKKKKQKITGNKFALGERVSFREKDTLIIGYIYEIHQGENGDINYDIQIGGECPSFRYNIAENILRKRN